MKLTEGVGGPWLPDSDPSIALAQAIHQETKLRTLMAARRPRRAHGSGAIVAAIIFTASYSIAAAEHEPSYLAGLGAMTCAQFNERVRRDAELAETMQLVWAQGYMSASNVWRTILNERLRDLSAWPESEQRAHLRRFCEQSPDASFGTAVQDLYYAFPLVSAPAEMTEQQRPGRP